MEDDERSTGENILAAQFSRLNHSDGFPDVLLRRTNLETFVDILSPWELIYLRGLVQKKPLALAGLTDLPDEIVAIISRYLDYRDSIACAQVSRTWRKTWTAYLVSKNVLVTHFSGLFDLSLPDASPWSLLQPAAAKSVTRASGHFLSTLTVRTTGPSTVNDSAFTLNERYLQYAQSMSRLDSDTTGNPIRRQAPDQIPHRSSVYCNGKVAWQSSAYSVFVDDIRAMTRTFVQPSDIVLKGETDFVVWTMSEMLLVSVKERSKRELIVYHLEKKQFRRVTLPSQLFDVKACNETLVITFSSQSVSARPHVWRWDGGLKKLRLPDSLNVETEPHRNYTLDHLDLVSDEDHGFIFHPKNNSLLYFVMIMVHKFDGPNYVETFRHQIDFVPQSRLCTLAVRCRPMSRHGLHNLCHLYDPELGTKAAKKLNSAATHAMTPSLIISHINFNTVTERFYEDAHELSGLRQQFWERNSANREKFDGIVWNEVIYYSQNFSLKARDESDMRWKSQEYLKSEGVICSATDFVTVVLTSDLCASESDHLHTIAADDDFLVLLTRAGYAIWNFGDRALKDGPWVSSVNNPGRATRLTAENTDCPVNGCNGPAKPGYCEICGVTAR
ncbi:hypothetical protein CCHL11_03675 [Colletotrichum chlorophyti]|uniref:F-box domain-containing protein n=1 Tax=Colletotrichum chlorophyti TaxID=708187 RepID=A0A1Q8RSP5_9PEZI|nr:hypothetical protein CCHL11_03675 [Colletotrichum chlorophyti]